MTANHTRLPGMHPLVLKQDTAHVQHRLLNMAPTIYLTFVILSFFQSMVYVHQTKPNKNGECGHVVSLTRNCLPPRLLAAIGNDAKGWTLTTCRTKEQAILAADLWNDYVKKKYGSTPSFNCREDIPEDLSASLQQLSLARFCAFIRQAAACSRATSPTAFRDFLVSRQVSTATHLLSFV